MSLAHRAPWAALLVLPALAVPANSGELENRLRSRWHGAHVVLGDEVVSNCDGRYTDNPVSGRLLHGRGERFAAGELGRVSGWGGASRCLHNPTPPDPPRTLFRAGANSWQAAHEDGSVDMHIALRESDDDFALAKQLVDPKTDFAPQQPQVRPGSKECEEERLKHQSTVAEVVEDDSRLRIVQDVFPARYDRDQGKDISIALKTQLTTAWNRAAVWVDRSTREIIKTGHP